MDSGVSGQKQQPNVKVIRVGTRESALAMAQTEEVVDKLKNIHKDIIFEVGIFRSIHQYQYLKTIF